MPINNNDWKLELTLKLKNGHLFFHEMVNNLEQVINDLLHYRFQIMNVSDACLQDLVHRNQQTVKKWSVILDADNALIWLNYLPKMLYQNEFVRFGAISYALAIHMSNIPNPGIIKLKDNLTYNNVLHVNNINDKRMQQYLALLTVYEAKLIELL